MEILACGVRDFCVGRRKRYRLAVSPVRYITLNVAVGKGRLAAEENKSSPSKNNDGNFVFLIGKHV